MKIDSVIPRRIKNISDYRGKIRTYADLYSALAVRSADEVEDLLIGAIKTHCKINKRNHVCEDDIVLIKMLEPYMIDPLVPDKSRVIKLLRLGKATETSLYC
jgi:hypothetical protein